MFLDVILASASPAQAQPTAGSPDAKGMFVEPANAPHRHCAGACLRSGTLQWFCKPHQTCSLDCGTAPPRMHCHNSRR
ncbi:hypothetical protein MMSR116_09235 [Methylobacterium mesophilicum SR1.6/6]|uniref:Uncharacterized protein n=1 Tax=Methylobacterium mesophilicum SR1.6/6 TaxID=908290 RepID=A0A6B9FX64_9HYPH|nr:hypothetical protein MMSR116_09235 [Methylobacterium mesophilicum SR1.6/6]